MIYEASFSLSLKSYKCYYFFVSVSFFFVFFIRSLVLFAIAFSRLHSSTALKYMFHSCAISNYKLLSKFFKFNFSAVLIRVCLYKYLKRFSFFRIYIYISIYKKWYEVFVFAFSSCLSLSLLLLLSVHVSTSTLHILRFILSNCFWISSLSNILFENNRKKRKKKPN